MRKLAVVLLFIVLVSGCIGQQKFATFKESASDVCSEGGRPVVAMFSTTWCPHCEWVKDTFDRVALEYMNDGKAVAYHWQLDTMDNTLTTKAEGAVPEDKSSMFDKYSPEGSVPVFVFGCKYYRVGNGYEGSMDLAAEEAEFRAVLDELTK